MTVCVCVTLSDVGLADAEMGFSSLSGRLTYSNLVAYYPRLAGTEVKTDDARVDLPRNLRELIFWPPLTTPDFLPTQ